jgi:peptide/nickel transport system permease protein
MIHLVGGDPVRAALGAFADPAAVAKRRAQLHLNAPLTRQFWYYLDGLLHLNFGVSAITGLPVSETIKLRFPNTLELAGLAMAFAAVVGLVFGTVVGAMTYSGERRWLETSFAWITATASAVPEFLMATLLVFVFAVVWAVFPVEGKEGFASLILPAAALGIPPAAILARIVRLEMAKVLGTDYMRTARSKWLPWHLFYLRHAMPNVITSALAIGGVMFAGLVGGSVIVEQVFAWPGVGTAIVPAIIARDFPIVQSGVLVLGLLVLVVNTLIDIALAIVNPRSIMAEL